MKVEIVSKTSGEGKFAGQSIDNIIVGQARVSSSRSDNELFDEPEKLLRHCILNQHWSIFTLANIGFEIQTSRVMCREILRHLANAGLTEFSQRYSSDIEYELPEIRIKHASNRQSSTEVIHDFDNEIKDHIHKSYGLYSRMINYNVAPETARFVLHGCTQTTIYMNFRIRELITFLNARLHKTAQKEINEVAIAIRDIFMKECPIISKCLFDFDNAYDIHILERIVLEKYKVYNLVIENNK